MAVNVVNDAESFDCLAGAYHGGSSYLGFQLDHKRPLNYGLYWQN